MMKDYQLVGDIEFYQNEKKNYMLSSEKLGVHLVMNENLYTFLKKLTIKLQEDDVIDYMDVNVEKAIEFLKKYQLLYLTEEGIVNKTTVEAEILGNKVMSKAIKMERRSLRLILILWLVVGINVVLFIANCIGIYQYPVIAIMLDGYQNFHFFKIQNIVIMTGLVFGSLCIHECGHALFANLFHVYVKNIAVYLHFGVAPMVFLKYRNIYHTSKQKRILIYAGGMIFNLYLVNLGMLMVIYMDSWIGATLAIMNLMFVLTNICSFVNTDSYFILCELFDFGSLKYCILKSISQLMKHEISWKECKSQPCFMRNFLFFIVSYLSKIWLLIQFTQSVLTVFQQNVYIKCGVCLLLVGYYIVTIIKFLKRIKVKVY